ncbi:MAG TPA: hypothetical protein VMW56_00610 [Candidatus Margulisiibacteriota bacterium]|nr:hypothetical protein [Candidatus Margulisiibacteriota bacterium]
MAPDRLPEGEKASPSRQPPVAEREPLTIVVIDAPPAEQVVTTPATAPAQVRARTDFDVPAAAPRRRWPFALLIGIAAVLLFSTYRNVFKPVALRFMHGIERRVVGERSYDLPHPPKSKFPQS